MSKATKNQVKLTRGDRVFNVFIYALMAVVLILCAYPLYFVVIASFSDPMQVSAGRVAFWPNGFTLKGYEMVFAERDLWIGYRNTIFYTLVGTLINITVTFPAAYAVSRREFMPRRVIMLMFVFTMFFNGGLIPTYIVASTLHLVNTRWILIMFGSVSVYNMILIRTFCGSTIPEELREAAKIDGCSTFGIYRKIILPLSQNGLATLTVLTFNSVWNDYMGPMIYLDSDRLKTIQLGLASFQQQFSADYGAIMAGTVCSVIPIIIVYSIGQKYIVEGVAFAGVKG